MAGRPLGLREEGYPVPKIGKLKHERSKPEFFPLNAVDAETPQDDPFRSFEVCCSTLKSAYGTAHLMITQTTLTKAKVCLYVLTGLHVTNNSAGDNRLKLADRVPMRPFPIRTRGDDTFYSNKER